MKALWAGLTTGAVLLLPGAAPQDPPKGKEFSQVVRPLVERHCLDCHGAKPKPKADIDFRKFRSEASLRADRKTWTGVVKQLNSHEMPPKKSKARPLPQVDRERLARAVEIILDRIDPNAPLDPGHVTLRRLNRTEYGNTVRDLLGVDFNPADDFPSDDIGHGFDNIGDVLTLSPVLMERYLGAAEALVNRAFPAVAPKVAEIYRAGKYLEPAGRSVPQSRYRPLKADSKDPIQGGPFHMKYPLKADGEYVFRFRAVSKEKGAKVAVLISGGGIPRPAGDKEADRLCGPAVRQLRPFRILKTLEVTSKDPRKAKWFEVRIPPTPGVERVAVALVKGTAKEVAVETFHVKGPLDPRPPFQRRMIEAVKGLPKEKRAGELLRTFARRAYRRPVTDAEAGRLAGIVEEAQKAGATWEASVGLALQAVLISPKFLFRAELDDRPTAPKAHPISEHQLASRLSYFIWASTPDEELLKLADGGKLSSQLEKQARRLLADPRARTLVTSFGMQWLQLQRIDFIAPDGGLFPSFNDYLRRSMMKETELFLGEVFLKDRSVLDLVAADYTFVDDRLGRHYRLPGYERRRRQRGPTPFKRVELKDRNRGGLLTQASVLTVTSNPTRTSPVKRGRWVLEQILGEPPPPPPPNVPELKEGGEAIKAGPLKTRMEQHRRDPNCANCHQRMDAIGFALENFDAIGAWRTKDGQFPVDAGGEFPDGTKFNGPADLRKVILDRKERFVRCLTEKLMTYALGRGVEPTDGPAVRRIGEAVAKDGHKFSRLVVEIVKSDPFRLRRGLDTMGAK